VKRIVINADDFGLCEGVNRAVEEAYADGILTSATIMTNMPCAEQAVDIARRRPNLGIGVHLTLTEGRPISEPDAVRPLLDADGRFVHSPTHLAILAVLRPTVRRAVEIELAAQIQWLLDRGIHPTHLDSHKHVHACPALFPVVCHLAARFAIPAIRFVGEPVDVGRPPWPPTPLGGRKRACLMRTMAVVNRLQDRPRVQGRRFFKTDALLGVAHTGRIDLAFFRIVAQYLDGCNEDTIVELMTHPGYPDGLDLSKTRLVEARRAELDALCHPKTRQLLGTEAIVRVHYGQI